jgi:hypothetical protein
MAVARQNNRRAGSGVKILNPVFENGVFIGNFNYENIRKNKERGGGAYYLKKERIIYKKVLDKSIASKSEGHGKAW